MKKQKITKIASTLSSKRETKKHHQRKNKQKLGQLRSRIQRFTLSSSSEKVLA